jgi:hypothetical protein
MVFNNKNGEFGRNKQMDFVSRLTFVRGLKDIPESTGPRERRKRKYKHWTMPEQPDGYIKCKRHDFL